MEPLRLASLVAIALIVSSCAEPASTPVTIGVGPTPQLPHRISR